MDAVEKKFSSLSIKDLLDAREAYHVHLAHLDGVYATAVGRYLIRDGEPRNAGAGRKAPREPRRLDNSSVQDWSWPCILVFVERWKDKDKFKDEAARNLVPPRLYLPDGRVVPTCVVEVDPDSSVPDLPPRPQYNSDLMGGGYPVSAEVQGKTHVGSIGCLVTDGDSVYALTNRHVTGEPGRAIFAAHKQDGARVGVSYKHQLGKKKFAAVYPGWPGEHVYANLDAGLIRIDSVLGWTAQVYGMGEIDTLLDLSVDSFSLDLIGCPVSAFGAVSGPMAGRIVALFYRYKTVGGYEYVSDFAIGPRDARSAVNNFPGDSGTLWFMDPDPAAGTAPPRNAAGAPRRRPFAMEWGGQVLLAPGAMHSTQLALATCLSTVCRELDVELICDWNTGHTEYWGEWGHTKIGAYACELIDASYSKLAAAMTANADNIGLPDSALAKWTAKTGSDGFAPLADVADLVWRNTRKLDESNHFADMDKPGPDGRTLLDISAKKEDVTPENWNKYYAGIGEDRRGALPFRVWQMFDEMVTYAAAGDELRFVTAGGLMAHYVGDAGQPLHVSQYHHGRDMTNAAQKKVHSVYETNMIGRFGKELIPLIADASIDDVAPLAAPGAKATGQDAAFAMTELMRRTVERLPPLDIVDLFNANAGKGQAEAMWKAFQKQTAQCMKDSAATLARIWEAAWDAGGKPNFAGTKFDYADMEKLYRLKCFVPSYRLDQVSTGAGGKLALPDCVEGSGGDSGNGGGSGSGKPKKPNKPKKKTVPAKGKSKKTKKAAKKAVKKKARRPRR